MYPKKTWKDLTRSSEYQKLEQCHKVLIYACGLRRSKLAKPWSLKIIDHAEECFEWNQGKGKKDRMIPISEKNPQNYFGSNNRYESASVVFIWRSKLRRKVKWRTVCKKKSLKKTKKSASGKRLKIKEACNNWHWLRHRLMPLLTRIRNGFTVYQELLGHNSSKRQRSIHVESKKPSKN